MTTYRKYTDVARDLAHDGTYPTVVGLTLPKQGYVVGREHGSAVDLITADEIEEWVKSVHSHSSYVGRWTEYDGAVYYDVVDIEPECAVALSKARAGNQLAIWDIANAKEILL